MKTTLFLAMAVLAFNQSATAKSFRSFRAVTMEQADFRAEINPLEKRNFAPVEDKTFLNPTVVLSNVYQKTIEEVITENNQITESNITDEGVRYYESNGIESTIQENNKIIESEATTEIRPLYLERTIEDQIAEDNAIIDSETEGALQVLDFETINKKACALKQHTLQL